MDHKSFCYWLNGHFELCNAAGIEPEFTPDVVKVMKDHLDLVFNKVTPSFPTFPRTSIGYPQIQHLQDEPLTFTC